MATIRRLAAASAAIIAVLFAAAAGGLYAVCPGGRAATDSDIVLDLVFDAKELAAKTKIAVLIPGTLNSISIFDRAEILRTRGYAIVRYRFPGMDGRPIDRRVDVDSVAEEIVTFATRHPDKQFYLAGFSIGGQIALRTAAMMTDRVEGVAVLSIAPGFPATFRIGWETLEWVATRAWSLRTLDFGRVWKEFYKVQLFGPAGVSDPSLSARADAVISERRDKIVTPTLALVCAHVGEASWRRAVPPARVRSTPVRFFHGEHDIVMSLTEARSYSSGFQRATLNVLDGQGHLIFATVPDLFDKVADFFDAPRR